MSETVQLSPIRTGRRWRKQQTVRLLVLRSLPEEQI